MSAHGDVEVSLEASNARLGGIAQPGLATTGVTRPSASRDADHITVTRQGDVEVADGIDRHGVRIVQSGDKCRRRSSIHRDLDHAAVSRRKDRRVVPTLTT